MPLNPALLLLTDSRLPAGGHAHSGGAEQAVASGAVRDVASLAGFLRGRLHTSGRVAAALAAAACSHAAATAAPGEASREVHPAASDGSPRQVRPVGPDGPHRDETWGWGELDAEADVRTVSPAQREASRTQGRLLVRVARRVWPSPALDDLALRLRDPHHPLALGVTAHAAGASSRDAALAAAYHAVTGPATAAVRLLGLDPVEVHRLLAELAPDLAATAGDLPTGGTWADLPACSAPALDLLAESHARAATRLFVS
ncbi:MAG: urease accessory protein UreF [Nonomuraea muscovyensis]|nr:urease accessory protein UreF [Nonomuraea muscovyensis]